MSLYSIFIIWLFNLLISFHSHAVSFLTISDIHYTLKPGYYGETDPVLWRATLAKLQQLSAQVDFVIFLGDLPRHGLMSVKHKRLLEQIVFHDLAQYTQQKPLFYVPGNNDSLAGDYQSFTNAKGQSPLNQADNWQHQSCTRCENLIINDAHMRTHGYYSTYVLPHNHDIALIVLNANEFSQRPLWTWPYPNQTKDAKAQLLWLKQQLQTIRAKQLLIAMHEEPGLDYHQQPVWQPKLLKNFLALLDIAVDHNQEVSILAGHSHYDEVREIRLSNQQVVFVYVTPAISTNHGNYSAMKRFNFNQDASLNNITTFFTSDNTHWHHQHFNLLGNDGEDILPQCLTTTKLAQCLKSYSATFICERFNKAHLYAVKNPRTHLKNYCQKGYVIAGDDPALATK